MGKYYAMNPRPQWQPKAQLHPVWRGVGCIMMVLIPFLSFGLAKFTISMSFSQRYIPYQLLGYPVMPQNLWKLGFLNPVLAYIQGLDNLYAIVILLLFYTIVLGALVTVVNAFIQKTVGPPRYGPLDMPPPQGKVKRYKR